MENGAYRSYWSVLPGEIVHDKSLSIAAKYLYVILSSMAYKDGFCWPSNENIASEMDLSKRRVVELLAMLRDAGYIRIIFRPHGKGERRYIYCGMFPERTDIEPDDDEEGCEEPQGGGAGNCAPPCENPHPPHAKNTFSISSRKLKEENIIEIYPPDPQKGERGEKPKRESKYALQEDAKPILRAYVGADMELAQTLGALIEVRVAKKAINSARAIKMLLAELDRLSNGRREDKLLILRQSVTNSWKSVFPLSGGGTGQRGNDRGPSRLIEEEGTYEL